jgi:electron transfer flavoprotein alpha subunit
MSILILTEKDAASSATTASVYKAAQEIAEQAGISQIDIKTMGDDNTVIAEGVAETIAATVKDSGYTYVLMAADSTGKNVLPRVSALLDTQQISEIIKVHSADTFDRPIYAGNAISTVQSTDAVKCITVRTTAFDADGADLPAASDLGASNDNGLSSFVKKDVAVSDRPELGTAKVVVSGGRALGSADNFKIIEALADKLGGAIGASRAAVDAGYVANDLQVGQTGKVVAPNLYIAIGISGAIQHLAGMKDSKTIVAINKDPDAPIFAIADYGLVGDLFVIVPELTSKL